MGLLVVLDHIERCSSNEDGIVLFNKIRPRLEGNEHIIVSFEGVSGVPTSFVNAAFIELLREFSFTHVRTHLSFANTSPQINSIINKRFRFEVNERNKEASL